MSSLNDLSCSVMCISVAIVGCIRYYAMHILSSVIYAPKDTHVWLHLAFAELYEQAIKFEKGSFITSTGALATMSGAKTGRSPKDKRVVNEETSKDDLWWGK
jgi:ATP-dependent phosphoenolpyruvate carboxykinase